MPSSMRPRGAYQLASLSVLYLFVYLVSAGFSPLIIKVSTQAEKAKLREI
jgi:hypothetical protein